MRVLGQVEGCFKSVRVIVRADRQFEVSGLCGWAVVEIQIANCFQLLQVPVFVL